MTAVASSLSHRDRALLRAVAAGRCTVTGRDGIALRVDGVPCADQFAAPRLVRAGLIVPPGPAGGPARLTRTGHTLLAAG